MITDKDILQQAANQLAVDIAQESKDLGAYRKGTLYESIDARVEQVNGKDKIIISMAYYGPMVNDGHPTRFGTSRKANYRPSPLHTKKFTQPKPFIDKGLEKFIDQNQEFASDLVESKIIEALNIK